MTTQVKNRSSDVDDGILYLSFLPRQPVYILCLWTQLCSYVACSICWVPFPCASRQTRSPLPAVGFRFMREPMRWLLANGRTHEVIEQLKKAAKMNKRNVQNVLDVFHRHLDTTHDEIVNRQFDDVSPKSDDVANDVDASYTAANTPSLLALETEMEKAKAEKLSFLDLFRHRRLRTNILCLWAVW